MIKVAINYYTIKTKLIEVKQNKRTNQGNPKTRRERLI